ncbi:hypothetical protein M422DRAFT_75942 [Sphaerobolus stellatus SS14]|uniref:Uncharacterized protein n=1 Tax=Sphaerobolus stellatus (strain SS14) TaxID=990650 RepID=A0A0C9VLS6_SPHS4|nr:hypothetical protein M422DRAFT_75942 [Sphaerobolus stellatus SS14]
MDDKRQGVQLQTTKKHTFRDGYALHMFERIEGSDSQIKFLNQGEGTSEVPLFGPMNNMIASFMWMASGIVGPLHYDLFKAMNHSDDKLLDFLRDMTSEFFNIILHRPERGFLGAKVLVSMMGETFGPLNLDLVTYFTHQKDLAQDKSEKLLKRSKDWSPFHQNPAKWLFSINDEQVKQLKLTEKAQMGQMLRSLQLANLNGQGAEPLPARQQIRLPGLYGSNIIRYGLPIIGMPATNPGQWGEGIAKELEKVVKQKTIVYLTNEVIIHLRNKVSQKASETLAYFELIGNFKHPTQFTSDIIGSGYLTESVANVLNPILVQASPAILDTIRSYATQNNLAEAALPLGVFRQQVTVRTVKAYNTEVYSVFVDRGALLEVWTQVVVETAFWGPEKREELVQKREEVLKQGEESTKALEQVKKDYESAHEAQKKELKDKIEKLEGEIKEREVDAKLYDTRLKFNKDLSKSEVKPEERYKEKSSKLLEKLHV